MNKFLTRGLWLIGLIAAFPAHSAVTVTDNISAWTSFFTGPHQTLVTNAAGIGLADEVSSTPPATGQTNLGTNVLTWQAANTGFDTGFRLTALQGGSTFVFDDDEGSNIPSFDDAISIGDIDNRDTDSFTLEFLSGGYQSLAMEFRDSDNWATETLEFFDLDGILQDTVDMAAIDSIFNLDTDNAFLGFRATYTIGSIQFNEATESGNNEAIAIANMAFAEFDSGLAESVPAPVGSALFGLVALGLVRRRLQVFGEARAQGVG